MVISCCASPPKKNIVYSFITTIRAQLLTRRGVGPCVYSSAGPDLDENLAVIRLRWLGLVLGGKEVRHRDVVGHQRVGLVCAHHCDDGEGHAQVVA